MLLEHTPPLDTRGKACYNIVQNTISRGGRGRLLLFGKTPNAGYDNAMLQHTVRAAVNVDTRWVGG